MPGRSLAVVTAEREMYGPSAPLLDTVRHTRRAHAHLMRISCISCASLCWWRRCCPASPWRLTVAAGVGNRRPAHRPWICSCNGNVPQRPVLHLVSVLGVTFSVPSHGPHGPDSLLFIAQENDHGACEPCQSFFAFAAQACAEYQDLRKLGLF